MSIRFSGMENPYKEMLESTEVQELWDRIDSSRKNRLLWKITYALYQREGFVNTVLQLMYYGGLYDAYRIMGKSRTED